MSNALPAKDEGAEVGVGSAVAVVVDSSIGALLGGQAHSIRLRRQ